MLVTQRAQKLRVLCFGLHRFGPCLGACALNLWGFDRKCECPPLRGLCRCHGVLQVVRKKEPLPLRGVSGEREDEGGRRLPDAVEKGEHEGGSCTCSRINTGRWCEQEQFNASAGVASHSYPTPMTSSRAPACATRSAPSGGVYLSMIERRPAGIQTRGVAACSLPYFRPTPLQGYERLR